MEKSLQSTLNNNSKINEGREIDNSESDTYLESNSGSLFHIKFFLKEYAIQINCNNINNEKYIYFYNLTLKEINKYSANDNLSSFYNYLKTIKERKKYEIEEKENFILLILKLDNDKKMNIKLSESITLYEAIKKLQNLEIENKNLKDKINSMVLNLNNFIEKYKNYKKNMNLNCLYNSFNVNSYKLEEIFSSLKSKIILNREEFGLINKKIY